MKDSTDDLDALSREKRELLDLLLEEQADQLDPLPLSFAQQRMWFLNQFEPDSPLYNIPAAVRLMGAIDSAALEYSLNQITQRHEVLRTTFELVDDQPVQIIHESQPLRLRMFDLREIPDAERDATVQRLTNQEARQPFDLGRGPLLRASLLHISDQEQLLLLTLHHIVADGWSIPIFVQELAAFYGAFLSQTDAELPELPIQYADYALWQREQLRPDEPGNPLDEQLAYWRQQLQPQPGQDLPVLKLPSDRPRPSAQTFNGARHPLAISQPLTDAIKELGRREHATPFMVLIAAFKTLLFRYTGQRDLLIGTPTAGRTQDEVEGLIGCFVNTLVLRSQLADELTFRELLHQVRATTLGAYDHQDLPFELLVEVLQPERDLSYSPLFQVQFAFHNRPLPTLALPGLSLELLPVETGTAKFDLSFSLENAPHGLRGDIEYNTDLFDPATIARLSAHFQTLLQAIVADPGTQIADLPLLTPAERQLLASWNATEAPYPQDACVHQLFEAQVDRFPDVTAVVAEDGQLTYAELDRRANQLAHHLRALGIGPDALVGICVERSLAMLIGLLGILKAGGAYIPLDPAYPAERIQFMLHDAQVPVLLTQQRLIEILPPHNAHVICLDQDVPQIVQASDERPNVAISAQNLAYVIYTSGSTGQPKGVQIAHQAVVNFLESMRRQPTLTEHDVLLSVTTLSFDIAALELFLPLTTSARVEIASREVAVDGTQLLAKIGGSGVTVMQATPATWRLLIEAGWQTTPGLKVLCGGEALPADLARQILDRGATLWNMYGPTETTIWSAVAEITLADHTIAIGHPIANTQIYLLDGRLNPVSIGVPGEIYIGGAGLARGYLKRPDLTAERFIPDPFGQPGARLYKTGDLGRFLPDGNIMFLGRSDQQVKLRGFRIELGEIAAQLASHPDIRECVVLLREAANGDQRLVAYIIEEQRTENKEQTEHQATTLPPSPVATEVEARRGSGQGEQGGEGLRSFLQSRLPDYMIPSAFVLLDALPLTPSGKIDRRALLAVDLPQMEPEQPFVAPRTPTEELIAGLWSRLLNRERVGIHDNFFTLGGHSLLATQVISRLRQSFAVELPLRALFEAPTVAGLAGRIALEHQTQVIPPILPLPRDGDLPLSFAQERLWFLHQLDPGSPTFNLTYYVRLSGTLDVDALQRSLNGIIARHEVLRTAFPSVAGQPVQRILPSLTLSLPILDLRQHDPLAREATARSLITDESAQPFNLLDDVLLRAQLLRLTDDEYYLLLTMHHIVADAWSQGVFAQELSALYAAFSQDQLPELAPLPIQYADYAVWQRHWLAGSHAQSTPGMASGEVLAKQLAYWRQQLQPDGALVPPLDLPTDRPRPAIQTFNGATIPVEVSVELTAALQSLSRQEGATLFMTLLAAFQTLLYRYSGQRDFAIGSPIANRTHADLEGLIGFFVNMLVLRARIDEGSSFRELLRAVGETALGAYAHQDLPFEKLVEELQLERDLSRSPLFEVMFILQNAPTQALDLPGVAVSVLPVPNRSARYDLTLTLAETPDGLNGTFEYNTDLFDAVTIARMAGHFQTLVAEIIADPERRIAELPLLPAEERRQILYDWNATAAPYPSETCIHQLFEDQAARTPDEIALVFKEQRLSYRELNLRANQLARHLRALGATADSLIGIYMERSPDMIIALLAALKAGAAYLPLDPAYPQERIALMINDAHAPVLLTQRRLAGRLPRHDARVVAIDAEWSQIAQLDDRNLPAAAAAQHLAYVIHTSGSTGQPKGVMVAHRNVLNFFTAMDQRIGSDPGVWLAVTSISFDISVLELLWTLTRGFQVVLHPEQSRAPQLVPIDSAHIDKPIEFSLFYFASDELHGSADKYRLLLEGAKFADQHGFAAVWTPERHFHNFGGLYPNPSVTSAAIAAITERVQIRAGSVVLPLHNPIRVAEEWSVVDNLSQGRVGISFASGWHADDFVLSPATYTDRKAIMFRDIETVRRLWRGESLTLPNGGDSATAITIHPQPIQPELPVWVTAAGSAETFAMAATIGANVLTHLLSQSVEELQEKIAHYRRAWQAAGHPGVGHVTLMLHTFVGDDLAVVREQVRQPFYTYLRSSLDLMKNLARSLGRSGETLTADEEELLLAHAFERYFQSSSLLGTPESCLAMVNRLKAIDVDELGCLIDFGVDADAVLSSLEHLNTVKQWSAQPVAEGTESADDGADHSLPAQIIRHQVTHFQCTPSMARMLTSDLEGIAALGSLHTLLLGGEALPPSLAQQLSGLPVGALHNMYGPTETTIWSTTQHVTTVEATVPIGRPVANTAIHILDRQLQPVPIGVPGELYIGGDGVVRGYLQRPDLTAERFIPDPFGQPGARLYKTGDLARYQADGTIAFLGRLDHQVKLQGHRIELGEIEAALSQHPTIDEAVVVVREDEADGYPEQRLVAYVVPQQQGPKPLRPRLSPAEEAELFAERRRYTLPNGMAIAHLSDQQANAVYREVMEHAVYLRHGITLNNGDCVFDVGANIGLFSLYVNQLRQNLRVYAFEPIPPTFDALRANMTLYGLNVRTLPLGLSRASEIAEFTFYPEQAGLSGRYADLLQDRQATKAIMLSGLQHNGQNNVMQLEREIDELLDKQFRSESHSCQLRTLSEIIREEQIERIDLLKIDVERSEYDVLCGIEDQDWPKIQQIVMEVDTAENLVGSRTLLERHGYDMVVEDLVVAEHASLPPVHVYMLYASRVPLRKDQTGDGDLATQWQASANKAQLSVGELRTFLKEWLPEYMIPAVFVTLPALPLTPNGKLDRRALPAPGTLRPELEVAFEAPKTEIEQALAGVWREVLHVEQVGLHDNFFELGGTSLLIVQARAQLRETLGYDLSLVDLFRYPTIAALAQHLSQPKADGSALDKTRQQVAQQKQARRQRRAALEGKQR